MSNKQSYDVFLAYAMTDRDWVKPFAEALKAEGLTAWFDVADLSPGARWAEEVEEALRASRTLVAILSSESVKNNWMFFEIGAAVADQKRIIPVWTEEISVQEIPLLLRSFNGLEATSPDEAGRKVAEAILLSEKGGESEIC